MSVERNSEADAAENEELRSQEIISDSTAEAFVTLEDLRKLLNQHVLIIDTEPSEIEKIQNENIKSLKEILKILIGCIESSLDGISDFASLQNEIKGKVEEGFDKKQLKNAIKDVIGNVLNVDSPTETNHEFKVSCFK